MARFGVEDIDALIGRGAGDAGALREIRRALERGEAVSASEQEYVLRLMAAHMGPGPRAPPPPARASPQEEPAPRGGLHAALGIARRRVAKRPSRRTVAIAAVAVAAIVSVAISVQGIGTGAPAAPPAAALVTDRQSYSQGDVVVISGRAEPGATVALSIVGPGGPVWNGTAVARADGAYSAMQFAGGSGWVEGAEHSAVASGAGVNASAAFTYGAAP
ncbi:MAG: hypothetical protein OXU25_02670 [Thaumarchaeota archaeon]|nr:hypothetical protein [Nitrososphaerota archaeon]